MKKIYWLLFLLIIGCTGINFPTYSEPVHYTRKPVSQITHPKIIPVVVDKDFSTQDRLSIDAAITNWNYVLNGYILINVESYSFDMEPKQIQNILSRHGIIIMKVLDGNSIIPDQKNVHVLAWVNDIGGNEMWIVRDRLRQDDIAPITMHELGHALGAYHELVTKENEYLLMYPTYNRYGYRCVDRSAMLSVAAYQKLPEENLNYCLPAS